jgi:N-acyl homoserine lactone hydrolase
MRRILLVLALLLAVGIGLLITTFLPATLEVPGAAAVQAPPPPAPPGPTVKAVINGELHSKAVFAYRGGSLGDARLFNMGAVLVEHPQGRVLIDAGLGADARTHLQSMPWLMRQLSQFDNRAGTADQLRAAGIDPASLTGVIITHAHWDHVSGLADMPGVPVLVPEAELDFINGGHPMASLARQIGTKDYRAYAFDSGPYLGFEASRDIFGDGSVVIVPAPGHTPGSVFVFVTEASGKRYAFIGDTAWQIEGVDLPAEKPWLSRTLVDVEGDKVRGLLVKLHQLKAAIPGLTVVPAHDRRVWETLPGLKG